MIQKKTLFEINEIAATTESNEKKNQKYDTQKMKMNQ